MRSIVIAAFLLAAGCGDNLKPQLQNDAGIDAVTPLTGCLDEPGLGVPMAPNGQLPCDLIPPGLVL